MSRGGRRRIGRASGGIGQVLLAAIRANAQVRAVLARWTALRVPTPWTSGAQPWPGTGGAGPINVVAQDCPAFSVYGPVGSAA